MDARTFHSPRMADLKVDFVFPEYSVVGPSRVVLWKAKKIKGVLVETIGPPSRTFQPAELTTCEGWNKGFVISPPPAGSQGGTHQGVGPETVGQHHPFAEGFILIILLGQLSWPVDAKASSIYCGGTPVESQQS